jgi:hypothetical protein
MNDKQNNNININTIFAILAVGLMIAFVFGVFSLLLMTIMESNTPLGELIKNNIRTIMFFGKILAGLLLIGVLVMTLYNIVLKWKSKKND